jgi:beta-glucosidase
VLGDQSALFGRGTVGEGCDRDDLELPGVQRALAERIIATGKPVILVLLTGRPYVVGWALEQAAAVVQGFFPGEEGAAAVAGVLSGRVNPSAKLPVSLPRATGSQPYTYLHPALGGNSDVTSLSSTPAREFGFGLSYTSYEHTAPQVSATTTDQPVTVSVTVRNTGDLSGTEVVQLYARDLVGSVTRPVAQLVGYARVELAPGEQAELTFAVPPTRLSFAGRDLRRIVEPGDFTFWTGTSATPANSATTVALAGSVHPVRLDDQRITEVTVTR